MSMLNMLLSTGGIKSLKNGFSGNSLLNNRYGLELSGFNYRQIHDATADGEGTIS